MVDRRHEVVLDGIGIGIVSCSKMRSAGQTASRYSLMSPPRTRCRRTR